jgi:hypothetical protein
LCWIFRQPFRVFQHLDRKAYLLLLIFRTMSISVFVCLQRRSTKAVSDEAHLIAKGEAQSLKD